MKYWNLTLLILLPAVPTHADLLVKSEPAKVVGQTAVVKLDLRNTFKQKVESARAAVFVMDPEGKVVGRSARWIITGQKNLPALPPGGTNNFNFVVSLNAPITSTNLTTKVQFVRVVLEHGALANIPTQVTVEPVQK